MMEDYKTYLLLAGPALGFMTFIAGTIQTKGVYMRPNSLNEKEFTFNGLGEFLRAPFCFGTDKFRTVWGLYNELGWWDRMKLLQLNWIAMTGLGSLVSLGLYCFM